MNIQDIIAKKRDRQTLTKEEIQKIFSSQPSSNDILKLIMGTMMVH